MTAAIRRIVIVGASVAGLSAADTLREAGFNGTITIVGDEPHPPYDRPPLSKSLLNAETSAQPLVRALRPDGHYAQMQFDLRLGTRAVGLDTDRRIVTTQQGELPYDRLVIASGCRARTMRTEAGAILPTLRNLDDALWLREAVRRVSNVVLIGSGFIGLEIAAHLRVAAGIDVTVLGAEPLPLSSCVGPVIAGWLKGQHHEHGVSVMAPVHVRSVVGQVGDYVVHLSDGTNIETQLVAAGIGVAPNIEWLRGSGVECGNGIVIDEAGRTSDPWVVAAGDVAAFPDHRSRERHRVEHWTHAVEHGRHVAANLLSGKAEPCESVRYFWTDQYSAKLQTYGRHHAGDQTVLVEGSLESNEFLALHGSDEEFHAVTSCGRSRALRNYRRLLQAGASWDEALSVRGATPSRSGAMVLTQDG